MDKLFDKCSSTNSVGVTGTANRMTTLPWSPLNGKH